LLIEFDLAACAGEDKPLKYKDMFTAADLMPLNKSDLLPYLDLRLGARLEAALQVKPRFRILTVSAGAGEGFVAFHAWIERLGSHEPLEGHSILSGHHSDRKHHAG
jgi:Ni2+-binding GTPase involved in maturation of urease and hydrogenase